MKKLLTLTASLITLNLLVACGPAQLPGAPVRSMTAASQLRSQHAGKPESETLKAGSSELGINHSRGQAKPAVPFTLDRMPAARDMSTTEVMRIARLGLDSMERASSYEDGYNVGRSYLDTLARQNSYVARLMQAGTNPEMKYESAYKATAKALTFISSNREISIPSICDLVRDSMTAAKTYEDGARIGYGTMGFIRQTASYSVRSVIDSSIRSAQDAYYWEDSYNILYRAYGEIRYMN
ncbi:MAG TPA: hypothetical protein V6D23_18070 [Candidatus Obscuribacterales bacterium]